MRGKFDAWLFMSCLFRVMTVRTFPWETSCLVWTKCIDSSIHIRGLCAANQKPNSLQTGLVFTFVKSSLGVWETETQKTNRQTCGNKLETPLIDFLCWSALFLNHPQAVYIPSQQTWLNHNHSMSSFPETNLKQKNHWGVIIWKTQRTQLLKRVWQREVIKSRSEHSEMEKIELLLGCLDSLSSFSCDREHISSPLLYPVRVFSPPRRTSGASHSSAGSWERS